MNIIHPNNRYVEYGLYFGSIVILTLFTYHSVLSFTFWKDDWFLLWAARFHLDKFGIYWIHPATVFEFFVLQKIFGLYPLYWQIFGLVLRVCSAISIMIMISKLTKVRFIGFMSGVLFATTPIGSESTGWASGRAAIYVVLFLCFGIYFLLEFLDKKDLKNVFATAMLLMLGFISDPLRAIPVFLIIAIIVLKEIHMKIERTKIYLLSTIFICGILVFGFFFRSFIAGTKIISFISTNLNNPARMMNGLHVFGNYFNSLFNLFLTGFVYQNHEISELGHGYYNKLYAYIGFGVIIILLYIFTRSVERRRKYRFELLFLLWIILFYFPNWFFEPRLIVTDVHRYLVLSSVGLVGLLSCLVYKIRSQSIQIILLSALIVSNITATHDRLAYVAPFRNTKVVEAVWASITNSIPDSSRRNIFMFSGEEPFKTNVIHIFGQFAYVLHKNIRDENLVPFIVPDSTNALFLLCNNRTGVSGNADIQVQISSLDVSSVYAWSVKNSGTVQDISEQERSKLMQELRNYECSS